MKHFLLLLTILIWTKQAFTQINPNQIKSDITKTISVSDVEIAKSVLIEHSAETVIQEKIGRELLYFPETLSDMNLVKTGNNALIQTIQHCYDEHRQLVLSPDIIWLTIAQGISIHINQNYNTLEPVLFKNKKPDKIVSRNDSLEFGGKHWEDLIQDLAKQTQEFTASNLYSAFCPQFSTTKTIEKTAYNINLLHTYKKAFRYVGESGCGIPNITLKGQKSDWIKLKENLTILDDFELRAWKENLIPIIDQFISVYSNELDHLFWQDIYKSSSQYNVHYISGWIIKLFPYIIQEEMFKIDREKGVMVNEKKFIKNNFLNQQDYLKSTLSTDNLPSGLSSVDIHWINHFKNENKTFIVHSGFMGIKQYKNKALEPCIAWSISDKRSKPIESEFDIHPQDSFIHQNLKWTPNIISKLESKAVYNPKKYKTNSSESYEFIRVEINKKIKANKSDTLNFIILSDGSITNVLYNGDQKNLSLIKNTLNNLESEWFPALADPKKIFRQFNVDENHKAFIKVNSMVEIPLGFHKP